MKPRWYQIEAIDAFFDSVSKHPNQDLLEVLPTGAGKTIVMAGICGKVAKFGRVVVLARSKELVCQNHAKFVACNPELADDAGVYCAGLGLKDYKKKVVFASIQSVCNQAHLFKDVKLVVIDEAHQVPKGESTQYQTFLKEVRETSPTCKLLGLTASPYRLDGGVIFGEGQQFHRVAYNVPLDVLFGEGYITRPKTLDVTQVDLTGVRRVAGDFSKSEVESKFLGNSITNEVLAAANDKWAKSVLIFASGVAHATVIKGELEAAGEIVNMVTGDTPPLFRDAAVESFSNGRVRWLVNVECLTTGFDAPCVDMVVIARATESPGLFLQMVGRGFRLFDGKEQCWILDYGSNLERFGPIDSSTYGMDSIKPASTGEGEAPKRICPSCFEINHAGARRCVKCGLEFPRKAKVLIATKESVLTKAEVLKVSETTYSRWGGKDGRQDTLMAEYTIESDDDSAFKRRVRQWICIEHEGWAGKKAHEWWMAKSRNAFPSSIDEALEIINVVGLAETTEIKVKKDGKYDKVVYVKSLPAPEPTEIEYGDLYNEEDIPF
jgi:DNA repair protein RadD